jgi:hypothetical protein
MVMRSSWFREFGYDSDESFWDGFHFSTQADQSTWICAAAFLRRVFCSKILYSSLGYRRGEEENASGCSACLIAVMSDWHTIVFRQCLLKGHPLLWWPNSPFFIDAGVRNHCMTRDWWEKDGQLRRWFKQSDSFWWFGECSDLSTNESEVKLNHLLKSIETDHILCGLYKIFRLSGSEPVKGG